MKSGPVAMTDVVLGGVKTSEIVGMINGYFIFCLYGRVCTFIILGFVDIGYI